MKKYTPEENFGFGILLLIFIIFSLFAFVMCSCAKERSCESCLKAVQDTVVIPTDTVPKDSVVSNMVAYYDIYIADNKSVKVIYPEYTSKWHPDTYWIMDSLKIKLDTTKSSTYKGFIDLRAHLPRNEVYNKGDTFLFRMEIRSNRGDTYYEDSTYLIY